MTLTRSLRLQAGLLCCPPELSQHLPSALCRRSTAPCPAECMLEKDPFIQACCLSGSRIIKQMTRQYFLHLPWSELCIGRELGLTRAENRGKQYWSILSRNSVDFVIPLHITVCGLSWTINCGKRRKVMTKSGKRNDFFVLLISQN